MKGIDKVSRNTLKKRALELVSGWECLEKQLKKLPTDHPMRIAVPAIASCREQLDNIIRDKRINGVDSLENNAVI